MVYKYPCVKFFDSLLSTHSVEEMNKLLVARVEFPDLRLVKIDAEHPMLDFDNLLARLEERHPSN